MPLRRACVPILTLSICALSAAGQQTSPPKSDDPATTANSNSQSSRPHIRLGGVLVSAGFTHVSGGYPYYGYYPGYWGFGPAWYDPFFSPFIHPGFYTGFPYQPYMGGVKIQTPDKSAWIYLDGALAGRADKLKFMWLDPGAYNLELRDGDRKFSQRIYVLSGRTLKVTPDMLVKEVHP